MLVSEFVAVLKKLDQGAEIGIFTAHAFACAPAIVKVNPEAGWRIHGVETGFDDPGNAYLIRPETEVI